MSDKSAIQWTDATWNPVRGCVKVSPGCAHCYAETFAERFRGVSGHPYEQGFDLRLVPEKLTEPLTWKKPRRVFVNSMSDLFQDLVPDSYIDQVFAVMALAPRHTFQLLTKRAERMRVYLTAEGVAARIAKAAQGICGFDGARYNVHDAARRSPNRLVLPDRDVFWLGSCNPPDQPYRERWILKTWPLLNVWNGVSIENQHFADERIPLLLQTPAAVRFISAEPLLGPVELDDSMFRCCRSEKCDESVFGLDWVIVGGESGRGARPFNLAWARSLIAQCKTSGVACFVKQLGKMPYEGSASPYACGLDAKKCRLYDLDIDKGHGGNPVEWPDDLRVREFPVVR